MVSKFTNKNHSFSNEVIFITDIKIEKDHNNSLFELDNSLLKYLVERKNFDNDKKYRTVHAWIIHCKHAAVQIVIEIKEINVTKPSIEDWIAMIIDVPNLDFDGELEKDAKMLDNIVPVLFNKSVYVIVVTENDAVVYLMKKSECKQ